tara:strand:- start:1511 stop:2737 length:1227 start_codon:yes stop_codon:yes gene_type:complete
VTKFFRGKNGLDSSKELYTERVKFRAKADERLNVTAGEPVIDFEFAEDLFYGRVDIEESPVVPDKKYLKPFAQKSRGTDTHVAMNFVADAFDNMITEFELGCRNGQLFENDLWLAKLKPRKAFVDIDQKYNKYIESELFKEFMNDFVMGEDNQDVNIRNFDDFIKVFLNWVFEVTESRPFTKSEYVVSKMCPIAVNGITIEVGTLDHSKDQRKFDDFFDSENFEFYKNAARKHGFSVDKNSPFRLVADLASPGMMPYMMKYGLNSAREVFQRQYRSAAIGEIAILKRITMGYWNRLVAQRPILSEVKPCVRGAKQKIVRRNRMTADEINTKYSDKFWLNMYGLIRYNEKRGRVGPAEFSKIMRNAKSILEEVDILAAMSYINTRLRGYYNQHGSFTRLTSKYSIPTSQ